VNVADPELQPVSGGDSRPWLKRHRWAIASSLVAFVLWMLAFFDVATWQSIKDQVWPPAVTVDHINVTVSPGTGDPRDHTYLVQARITNHTAKPVELVYATIAAADSRAGAMKWYRLMSRAANQAVGEKLPSPYTLQPDGVIIASGAIGGGHLENDGELLICAFKPDGKPFKGRIKDPQIVRTPRDLGPLPPTDRRPTCGFGQELIVDPSDLDP
jgi:hypothetical protein